MGTFQRIFKRQNTGKWEWDDAKPDFRNKCSMDPCGSLSGRRVLEVLLGIQMGTMCLRKAVGMKLELLVLHSLNIARVFTWTGPGTAAAEALR